MVFILFFYFFVIVSFYLKKLINNAIKLTFAKSINNAPTTGTTKNASLEYLYFSHTDFIFEIPLGVAPNPNPQCPDTITAAS